MSAAPEIQNRFLWCYEDPRSTPAFKAEHYPEAKGSESTLLEGIEMARAQFQAVYARRNAVVRALEDLEPGDQDHARLAKQILFLTEAIDHLEDLYTPIGFVAEPVMDHTLFTRELVFTHAQPATEDGAIIVSSFSIYIPIPREEVRGREDPDAP